MSSRKYSLHEIKDMDNAVFWIRNTHEAFMMRDFLESINWRSQKGNKFSSSWIEAMSCGTKGIRIKAGKRGAMDYYRGEGYKIFTFDDIGVNVVLF